VLESQYKEASTPSLRSLVVNEERMKPGQWVESVLCHVWLGEWQEGHLAHKTSCQVEQVENETGWLGFTMTTTIEVEVLIAVMVSCGCDAAVHWSAVLYRELRKFSSVDCLMDIMWWSVADLQVMKDFYSVTTTVADLILIVTVCNSHATNPLCSRWVYVLMIFYSLF